MHVIGVPKASSASLVRNTLAGDRRALARLLTIVENGTPEGRDALVELYPFAGKAHLIGITGSPGTGKSTLVSQLALYFRHPPSGEKPRKVAVVAVDPSSPFSGGAVLGDRVRMRDLAGDPGVFIRSMASRGALGGLAQATSQVVQVLDAAGYEIIMIETVGAGQSEVEIARLAYTTLVVEAPGMGDDIQAIKAGLLEIADILVINKADRPGIEAAEHALRSMLEMHSEMLGEDHGRSCEDIAINSPDALSWIPPVVCTVATQGKGIDQLAEAIDAHRQFLNQKGCWYAREMARVKTELVILVRDALLSRWRESMADDVFQRMIEDVASRRLAPQQAVQVLISNLELKI